MFVVARFESLGGALLPSSSGVSPASGSVDWLPPFLCWWLLGRAFLVVVVLWLLLRGCLEVLVCSFPHGGVPCRGVGVRRNTPRIRCPLAYIMYNTSEYIGYIMYKLELLYSPRSLRACVVFMCPLDQ